VAAGLCPDPLGSLCVPKDPIAAMGAYFEGERRGRTYEGMERREGGLALLTGTGDPGGKVAEKVGKGIPPPEVKVSRINTGL